jgi:putative peptidoglycan lipid II flippase
LSTPQQAERATSESVVRSAGIVSIAVFSSRVTGLIREQVFAAMFGAGKEYDAFSIGFRIPNLTRDLFAEGALSSAFVPTFTHYLAKKSKEEAAELANLVATAIVLVVGGLCLLGMIFSPQLVDLLAGGFRDVPGKFELAVTMTRIMFPFLLLVALAAQAMGILNACNQFAVPATASTMFNIGSLVFGLLLGKVVGPYIGLSAIYGMAYGVVLGGAVQLTWQLPALRRAGFAFRPRINWADPGMRRILILIGPAILGNAAVQINVAVNSHFASRLGDGPISWLQYAFRFMQLPIGIFGYAIAAATLPAVSRAVSNHDYDDFRHTLSQSLGMVFVLTVPSAVGLVVLRETIVSAIYEMGRFDALDTQQTALALACYSIGLVGYAAAKVINPAFYALNDSRTPMIVSTCSIAINLGAVLTLLGVAGFGHAGLALSTSAVAIFSSMALFLVMRSRIGGIYGRNLWRTFSRVSVASLLMGGVVWLLSSGINGALGTSKVARLIDLAVSIPVGILVLYLACRLLHVSELDAALRAVLGPLQRRIPFLRAKIGNQ